MVANIFRRIGNNINGFRIFKNKKIYMWKAVGGIMNSVLKVAFLFIVFFGLAFAVFLKHKSPKRRRKRKISNAMKLINNAVREMAKMAKAKAC